MGNITIQSNKNYNETVQSTIMHANIVMKNIDSGKNKDATKLTVDMFNNISKLFKDKNLNTLFKTDLGDFDFLIPNFKRDNTPNKLDVNYIRLKQSNRESAELIFYYSDRVNPSNNKLLRLILTQSNKSGLKVTKEVSNYKRILGEKTVMSKLNIGA